jgi:hypothetical protein
MNVFRTFLKKVFGSPNRYKDDDWPSVVLLLREPIFPEPETIVQIAEGA